jgi:hypothetical protein
VSVGLLGIESMSTVVQCNSCGGSVVYDAELEASKCIFCGSTEMGTPEDVSTEIPSPDAALQVHVDSASADDQYRSWATASWWTPKELRSLTIELKMMFIPAWWIRGEVESHWSGLLPAATQSGKMPTGGISKGIFEDMVPASQGITAEELEELHPFNHDDQEPWSEEDQAHPFEMPALSQEGAQKWLHERLSHVHMQVIQVENGLVNGVASSQVEEKEHKLFMIPIYIGAFRFRDRAWRFVINAQTGEVVGDTPVDRAKVAKVVGGSLMGLWVFLKAVS